MRRVDFRSLAIGLLGGVCIFLMMGQNRGNMGDIVVNSISVEENDGEVHNYIISIIERALISQTLNTNGGNQLKAAESLGLNRNTLRKKIIDLNIDLQSNKKNK